MLDILVAAAALLLASPVLVVAAVRIKAHDGGPIFYRAARVGRGGATFHMHKFRTMVLDADRLGPSSTPGDDPRITPVGRWMRRWKVDEIPQFIDVLTGNMSVVGPRPQVRWAVDRYSDEERKVLEIRPGITDWASIAFANEGEILRGHPDPDKAYMALIHPLKMRLALRYVRERSMVTDLRIVWLTAAVLLGRKVTPEDLLKAR